ncbi:MAG: (Fe-S)-binding protein [bacterium]|nr:(Fe-S)-binding protein [bacterium]
MKTTCTCHTHQESSPKHEGFFTGVNIPDYEKILNCIRCGMCLPHCPTYREMKMERATPRGRAALIRAVADGQLELNRAFADQVFLCLDCRACETACPSGVRIGYLIESARAQVEQNMPQNPIIKQFKNFIFGWLFLRHWRLELMGLGLRFYQNTGFQKLVQMSRVMYLFPRLFRFMEALPPTGLKTPLRKTLPAVVPAQGEEKTRVGYFLGCMMSIMFNKTTSATLNVLTRSGCTVVSTKDIRCCGAPLLSEGYKEKAKTLMRENLDLFDQMDVEYIVTDCAACGAALKEYAEFMEDDPVYHEKAHRFSAKIREITEFLAEWPHYVPPRNELPNLKVIYDTPCHLGHAQQVWDPHKKLVASVKGVELAPLPEHDWCCGSAGIYNITHHEMAMQVLDRKMDHIEKTGADILLTANPGCLLQLAYGVKERSLDMDVRHVVELLDDTQNLNGKCGKCGRKPRPECAN